MLSEPVTRRRGTEGRRGSAPARPRGAAPRQRRGTEPRSQSQSRGSPRPGWDEDTRAPTLFDTRLRRHIFQPYSRAAVESVMAGPRMPRPRTIPATALRTAPAPQTVQPAQPARPKQQKQPKHQKHQKPGQLRRRLQVAPRTDRPESGVRPSEEVPEAPQPPAQAPSDSKETTSDPSGWPPPLLPFQVLPVTPGPEQLQVTHMQRRHAVASLSEKLAILLPDPQEPSRAGQVLLMPPVPAHDPIDHVEQKREIPIKLVDVPTMPAKAQSLSQKLSALLGPEHPPCPSPQRRRDVAPGALLQQNAAEVVRKVDFLTDGVLEHLLGDALHRLDALPEKRQQHSMRSVPSDDRRPQPRHEEADGQTRDPRAESLEKLVQHAEDKLEMLEHELKLTYLQQEPAAGRSPKQEARHLHVSSCPDSEEEEEEEDRA
ncbi:unnamed protein product [Symbiodinium natans]|uniref:Uncharacterized protein n=1 Tax=Symbiodinium natans TaxID=878477 RepID=A0A812REJ6_9DINO|nr:unnamed protein product [Symbiodinium natans]